MNNSLLENESIGKLFFKFALPGVIGMLIVSIQTMIDGIFVSRAIGPLGLAAINLTIPYIQIVQSVAIMIIIGGAVLAGIALGENNYKKYLNIQNLTLWLYIIAILTIDIVSLIFKKQLITFLGTTPELYSYVNSYLTYMIIFTIFYVSPIFTETFIRLLGKPNLVFISGSICFLGNIILDYIFIYKFNWGIEGAAIATCIANLLGTLTLIKEFKFVIPKFSKSIIKNIFYNGSSEMLTVISSAITTFIFNQIILKYIGQIGISAFTIIFYINSLVTITLYGISQALQPIISYNIGAKNFYKIKKTLNISLITGGVIGISTFFISNIFSDELIGIFAKNNKDLFFLGKEALFFFAFAYIFSFVSIIASSFHTAIEKPLESVFLAWMRSLVFIILPLFFLSKFFGQKGIWLATPTGEFLSMILSLYLIKNSLKKLENCLKK
ncbi:MATE family efflux transporter [Cetobacterium ceti]